MAQAAFRRCPCASGRKLNQLRSDAGLGFARPFDPNLVTGVVLAGGKSSRLETPNPKALISLGGKMLLARVADVLKPMCNELILVVRKNQEDDTPDLGIALGMHVVEDSPITEGPVAGLLAGLANCTTPLAFAIGADHPFLSTSLILEMLRRSSVTRESFAAVLIRYRGMLNPLHAVYPVSNWLDVLEITVKRGGTSLVSAIATAESCDRVHLLTMTEDDVNVADPQHMSLFDIDTLEDLGVARRIVDRRSLKVRPDLRKGGL